MDVKPSLNVIILEVEIFTSMFKLMFFTFSSHHSHNKISQILGQSHTVQECFHARSHLKLQLEYAGQNVCNDK